jgi:Zn-dependent protease
MFDSATLVRLLMATPPILFALTIHEFAHAWTAVRCGDATPELNGRLTLNPVAHLDPVGTLCIYVAMLSGFGFGWAKPVPVNPFNFRHPRRDDILVSVAGVATNLATAVAVALLLRLALATGFTPASGSLRTLWSMAQLLCVLSVCLAFFNLIPLPPLDGSHVLRNLLPREAARSYERMAPFGSILLLILIISGGLGYVLGPPVVRTVVFLLGPALPGAF